MMFPTSSFSMKEHLFTGTLTDLDALQRNLFEEHNITLFLRRVRQQPNSEATENSSVAKFLACSCDKATSDKTDCHEHIRQIKSMIL